MFAGHPPTWLAPVLCNSPGREVLERLVCRSYSLPMGKSSLTKGPTQCRNMVYCLPPGAEEQVQITAPLATLLSCKCCRCSYSTDAPSQEAVGLFTNILECAVGVRSRQLTQVHTHSDVVRRGEAWGHLKSLFFYLLWSPISPPHPMLSDMPSIYPYLPYLSRNVSRNADFTVTAQGKKSFVTAAVEMLLDIKVRPVGFFLLFFPYEACFKGEIVLVAKNQKIWCKSTKQLYLPDPTILSDRVVDGN